MKNNDPATSTKNPVIKGSIDNFKQNISLVVDGIASVFGKHCEVVLHDLRKPDCSIFAIANGHVTGRKVGGPIIGGPIDDEGLKAILEKAERTNVVSNYTTRTRDGRTLKSTTVIFRNSNGTPVIALCINLDLTEFNKASELLVSICRTKDEIASVKEMSERQELLHGDVSAMIKDIVDDAIAHLDKPINLAEKEDKLKAIKMMYERGLFLVRGGVEYAAKALGVSRFTIYNYLKELQYHGLQVRSESLVGSGKEN